jgi:hypothetical protein
MSATNRFADVDNVESLVYILIGAGSACWENLSGAGVFDSTLAQDVGRDGVERLSQLIGGLT